MKLICILLPFCLLLCVAGCSTSTHSICTKCGAEIDTNAIYCSSCGTKIGEESVLSTEIKSVSTYHSTTSPQVDWTSCPVYITGGISGSSYSEYFSLHIENNTNKDIDSVKILISFTHTGADNQSQFITGTHTFNTIWADNHIKETIPATGYNFSKAAIFPVCVYFKDGTKWGDSSADYDTLCKYTRPFYIEHFAIGSVTNNTTDNSTPQSMLPQGPEDGEVVEEWYYEFPERDLDGMVGYLEDVEYSDSTEYDEPAE